MNNYVNLFSRWSYILNQSYLIRQSSHICFLIVVAAEGLFAESTGNQVLLDPQTFWVFLYNTLIPFNMLFLIPLHINLRIIHSLSVINNLLCHLAEGYIVWLSLYVKSLILILMALSCVENVDMFHLK